MGSGCYLGHVAGGQARLLWRRTPVATVRADPATPDALRAQLERVEAVRAFGASLGLDVGDRYTSYVAWPGDALVTSVVATRPGEVDPVTTWFPIVGAVPYRGWFDPELAEVHARSLRRDGLDVCVVSVAAYSTLGWFDDPVTGPMLRQPDGVLVETLLHELLHATVFVPGDADFNEGVAAFFGEEAGVRFFAAHEGEDGAQRARAAVDRQRRVRAEILGLRREVEGLYASEPAGPARDAARATLEAETRGRLAALAGAGVDATGWANGIRLNDACLALSGTYHADTPALARVLDGEHGELRSFLAAVRRAAEAEDPRAALLQTP